MAEPEDPTRRIPPSQPPAEREVEVTERPAGPDPVLEELGSLKRAVALLGVLAALALGVGLWALLQGDGDDDTRRGAGQEQVRELNERVDQLESDVEDAATDESVVEVRDRQDELEQQIGEVADQAGDGGEATQAVEEVAGRVEELEAQVEELEQQQAEGSGTDTGP